MLRRAPGRRGRRCGSCGFIPCKASPVAASAARPAGIVRRTFGSGAGVRWRPWSRSRPRSSSPRWPHARQCVDGLSAGDHVGDRDGLVLRVHGAEASRLPGWRSGDGMTSRATGRMLQASRRAKLVRTSSPTPIPGGPRPIANGRADGLTDR
jgi:hypothetical protein